MVFGEAIFLNCAGLRYKIADGTFEYILNFGAVFQSLLGVDRLPRIVKVALGMSLKLTWQGIFKCELLCKFEPVLGPITPCTFPRLSMPPIMVGITDSVAAKLHRESCLASRRMCRLDHGEHDMLTTPPRISRIFLISSTVLPNPSQNGYDIRFQPKFQPAKFHQILCQPALLLLFLSFVKLILVRTRQACKYKKKRGSQEST